MGETAHSLAARLAAEGQPTGHVRQLSGYLNVVCVLTVVAALLL